MSAPSNPSRARKEADSSRRGNDAGPLPHGRSSDSRRGSTAPLPHGRGSDSAGGGARQSKDLPNHYCDARAYLITFTTYGTWVHGDERGSVDREHNIPDAWSRG